TPPTAPRRSSSDASSPRRSSRSPPNGYARRVTSVAVPGTDPGPLSPGADSAPAATPRRGGLAEFLLVGGATLVLFPLAWLGPRVVRPDAAALAARLTALSAA